MISIKSNKFNRDTRADDYRRPDLLNAIVQAANPANQANHRISRLGNFVKDWDFSRFAQLFNHLRKDPQLPNLLKIKDAVGACRDLRNDCSHPDYNPEDQGLTDAKLASVLHLARETLPTINRLSDFESGDIYRRIELLENLLYSRQSSCDTEFEVWYYCPNG